MDCRVELLLKLSASQVSQGLVGGLFPKSGKPTMGSPWLSEALRAIDLL